jgi:hypothetical protein
MAFIRSDQSAKSLAQWRDSEYYTETDEQLERQVRFMPKGLLDFGTGTVESMSKPIAENLSIQAGAGSLDDDQGESRVLQVTHESVRQFFLNGNGFRVIDGSHTWIVGDGHFAIMDVYLDYIQISLVGARYRVKMATSFRPSLLGHTKSDSIASSHRPRLVQHPMNLVERPARIIFFRNFAQKQNRQGQTSLKISGAATATQWNGGIISFVPYRRS